MDHDAPAQPGPASRSPRRAWWRTVRHGLATLALGSLLFLIFESNFRELGTVDTVPTALVTVSLARGEGPYLDRFGPALRTRGGLYSFVTPKNDHLVSRYPIAPALLAFPLVWPQILWWDRVRPGWDREPGTFPIEVARSLTKHAMAFLAALTAMVLYRLLHRLDLAPVALPATLAAALGSDSWSVGSQALWQHGPAALMLSLSLLAFADPVPSRRRCVLGGIATALMVACRAIDLIFALAILGGLVYAYPRRVRWFLPGPVVIGSMLLAYNLLHFGALSGGQAELEALHPEVHAVEGPWAGRLFEGLIGTLFSPARGLLVYCPWVALTIGLAPWTIGKLRRWPVILAAMLGLPLMLLVFSKYAVWWGGHCFGPRYWTDATPLFAILLALALDWSRRRFKPLLVLFLAAILWSIALQSVGAYLYPSNWNVQPTNIDLDHARLWDWRDTEVSRCLIDRLGPILRRR